VVKAQAAKSYKQAAKNSKGCVAQAANTTDMVTYMAHTYLAWAQPY
jgi:hypothetical protein